MLSAAHRRIVLGASALVALVAMSVPRRVGDGNEYLAMALRFAGGRRPFPRRPRGRRDARRFPRPGDDPNIGLLPNFPALGLVLLGAVAMLAVVRRGALASAPVVVTALLALVFLACFAQTTNFNSGATPGPARYGLWLVPLALPLLDAAAIRGARWWTSAFGPLALVSCAAMLYAYRPALPESYLSPTRLASFLWTSYPWLDDPLPEVFSERVRGDEVFHVHDPVAPVATPSCSKALLVGGEWPRACGVRVNAPVACNVPRTYCYANLHGSGTYRFRVRGPY